jgi:hypothetical protein
MIELFRHAKISFCNKDGLLILVPVRIQTISDNDFKYYIKWNLFNKLLITI